jgi:hypothetical protein
MTGDSPEAVEERLSRFDTTAAHSARVWNYLLGGKDHFAADRETPDSDKPHALLRRYLDSLPPGSCLALCDGTDTSPVLNEAIAVYNQNSASSYHLRSPEQIEAFFDGLALVPPGLVPASRWRSEGEDTAGEAAGEDATICGVGFKQ